MLQPPWFYHVNLVTLWVGVAVILILCSMLGNWLGVSARRRSPDEATRPLWTSNFVASSILSILALILGFTFSLAIGRFENRRQLVIEEANAIGTTYLRLELLRSEEAARLKELLKQYLDARIDYYETPLKAEAITAAHRRVDTLQKRIWLSATHATRTERGAIESIFINSLNSMLDLEKQRTIALEKTLPEVTYWVILMLSGAGLAALEFGRGLRGERGRGGSLLLVVVVSCVFMMIHDLERPRDGAIRVTQEVLISLRDTLASG